MLIVALAAISSMIVDKASAEDQVNYLQQIKPVLASAVTPVTVRSSRRPACGSTRRRWRFKGGDSGPAIKPGDAAASAMIQRVTANDESERMPAEGEPLKAEQIAALRTWIAQKAQRTGSTSSRNRTREITGRFAR